MRFMHLKKAIKGLFDIKTPPHRAIIQLDDYLYISQVIREEVSLRHGYATAGKAQSFVSEHVSLYPIDKHMIRNEFWPRNAGKIISELMDGVVPPDFALHTIKVGNKRYLIKYPNSGYAIFRGDELISFKNRLGLKEAVLFVEGIALGENKKMKIEGGKNSIVS